MKAEDLHRFGETAWALKARCTNLRRLMDVLTQEVDKYPTTQSTFDAMVKHYTDGKDWSAAFATVKENMASIEQAIGAARGALTEPPGEKPGSPREEVVQIDEALDET